MPIILHSFVLIALCKREFLNSNLKQRFYLDFFNNAHCVYVKIFVQLQVVEKGIKDITVFGAI